MLQNFLLCNKAQVFPTHILYEVASVSTVKFITFIWYLKQVSFLIISSNINVEVKGGVTADRSSSLLTQIQMVCKAITLSMVLVFSRSSIHTVSQKLSKSVISVDARVS